MIDKSKLLHAFKNDDKDYMCDSIINIARIVYLSYYSNNVNAEDIQQAMILEMYSKLSKFNESRGTDLYSWLYRVAKNAGLVWINDNDVYQCQSETYFNGV